MTPATLTRESAPQGESTLREPTLAPAGFDPIVRRLEGVPAQRFLSLTFPAPVAPAHGLLEAAAAADLEASDHGFVWQPPSGASWSGVGVCSRLSIQGPDRFRELRQAAADVFERLDRDTTGGAASAEPRFFGGLAFDVGAAAGEPWAAFGDGCFTLPRWLYRRHGQRADLTLSVGGRELATTAPRIWAERARALTEALGAQVAGPLDFEGPQAPRLRPDPAGDAAWTTLVDDIRRAIVEGSVEKIVAARRFSVELPRPRSVARTLAQLARHRRPSTAFAFCRPGADFVGLTPERLITKEGRRVETEALAGSIESGGEHAAELMGSGKDRLEQQLVVDAIVRRLEPLCAELEVAARPSVRELRDVLHLHTPIVGTLASPRHVLELAELLHPTPAVGGVPTEKAMAWIAEREEHPRGWYASPVGWFDAAGDGELAVALRSCLLQPEQAHLYAGAGIVRDSDPRRELDEVELKLQTLLHALEG